MSTALNVKIDPSWYDVLRPEFESGYFQRIKQFLLQDKGSGITIYPPGPLIFNAYNLTPLPAVKLVILGQDPYHGVGQAHGLCFSVPSGIKHPPSLVNIFKEIQRDTGLPYPQSGCLEPWARQGVLLLNSLLTVRAGQAASHAQIGWQQFTDATIRAISNEREGIVFLLWGAFAIKKRSLIDERRHYILTSAHPSPLSAYQGFIGNGHFTAANDLLLSRNLHPIDWRTE